ncbi:MAG TPA: hypothetical protein VGL77_04065 [Armatimonadota bacterium]|jgi:hypothetical protein
MDITQFRDDIYAEFGSKLEHATPANVRRFLNRMHLELGDYASDGQPFVIPREDATNYEQVVAEFLSRVLKTPPEQGIMLLWIFASELFYARLGEQYEEKLSDLLYFDLGD